MLLNDAHIQLGTAIQPVEPVDSRKGRTFLADVQTDKGRVQAHLKLLSIEDIAREALCATLARKLSLPIPQAYYVSVDPSHVGGYADNLQNIAFGLRSDRDCPTFSIRSADLDHLVHDWKEPDLTHCAVFDEWIFNRDRLPDNLVYDGTGVYWLINHDAALPNDASPGAPADSPLLQLLSQAMSEIELWRLRENAMKRVQQYKKINWVEILKLLRPDNLPGSEDHYDRYISFLRDRLPAMREIITTSIGIRQGQLQLGKSSGFKQQI